MFGGSPLFQTMRSSSPAAGQLLPARTQYLHRALGSRLLPEEAAAALRLCASAASAVFSNRAPWSQLRAELRREAEVEAALLGAGPIGRVPSAPAGAAATQDKVKKDEISMMVDVQGFLGKGLSTQKHMPSCWGEPWGPCLACSQQLH